MDWTALRRGLLAGDTASVVPPRVRLPVLPLTVLKFARKANQPNVSPRTLGEIIEVDAGLTCELLRFVNSSARGMSRRITSAYQAIALLGIRESKLYLLTAAVERSMKRREWKFVNIRDFWATNLQRALVAEEVARLLKADEETAFASAMLMDFLLPALTNDLFPRYRAFMLGKLDRPTTLSQYERKTMGWDHAEAAARLMAAWEFPDELICCTLLHHQGLKLLTHPRLSRSAAAAVAVAALIPDPFDQVPDGLQALRDLDARWPAFNLREIAERVHERFEQRSTGTDTLHAALNRHPPPQAAAR